MTDKLFTKLWMDALGQPDKERYIAEYGYPVWFDKISNDIDVVVETLGNIHDVAHMEIKEMISSSGLSQAGFATKFCIPKRTIENWCMGIRKCPDYTRLMIARSLGLLKDLEA